MKFRFTSVRALIVATIAIETVLFVWTGVIRYASQGLAPRVFDLTQTGNILACVFWIAIVWPAIRLFFRKDCSRQGAIWLAAFSGAAIIALFIHGLVPPHELDTIYLIFGVLQLCALGLATALVSRDETHIVLRSAQHTAIIAVFIFAATLVFQILTPTDVAVDARADAAVILGAAVWSHNRPSPLLRMRIAKANDLLRTTTVRKIICTGSNALGEHSESVVEEAELIKLGVDSSAIITETHTNSTISQILFLRDSLAPRGMHSFVIVSDHFHLQRALQMCKFNGIAASGAASESLLPWTLLSWYRLRDAAAMLLYWGLGV